MDPFFTKHKKEVFKLCDIISAEISTHFNINKEALDAHLSTVFKKSILVRCEGFTKSNNTRCAFSALENECYCRRHIWCKNDDNIIVNKEPNRCTGINKNGMQCMVRATVDDLFCKKHMYQTTSLGDDSQESYKCIHYELDEDGQEQFVCDSFTILNTWCCQKHERLNKIYTQHFKARGPDDYLQAVDSAERSRHALLDERYLN
jgi:hypothetical protein